MTSGMGARFAFGVGIAMAVGLPAYGQSKVVHDAEYYILKAQNGEKWAAEDKALDAKLAELRKKHGHPPNIIYLLWDDMAFGDAGIPEINKIRGFDTPSPKTSVRRWALS